MALIRWQPFQEFETLRRQMDQIFAQVAGSERQSATSWQPAIELQDTEENGCATGRNSRHRWQRY